jgi:hypothetical protein
MRNIAASIFCLALAVVCGCAGGAARESMNRAAAVEFEQDRGLRTVGDPVVLMPLGGLEVTKVDGNPAAGHTVPGTDVVVLEAGRHTLSSVHNSKMLVNSAPFVVSTGGPVAVGMAVVQTTAAAPRKDVTYDFQSGRTYTYEQGASGKIDDMVLTPVTDPALLAEAELHKARYFDYIRNQTAAREDYLAYSRENPGVLDGVWQQIDTNVVLKLATSGDETALIEIAGDRITYTPEKVLFFGRPAPRHGELHFDANSLTVVWDIGGQKMREEWAYAYDGEVLEITFDGVLKAGLLSGKYKRRIPPASEPEV